MPLNCILYHLNGLLHSITLRSTSGKCRTFYTIAPVFSIRMKNYGIFFAPYCYFIFLVLLQGFDFRHILLKIVYGLPDFLKTDPFIHKGPGYFQLNKVTK